MLTIGQTFDRYTVEAELETRGFVTVFRIRHQTLGSLHALKVLSVQSAALRERLAQEGRVQGTLRHPNIVAVTDVIDIEGSPGLIMEYVAGPTLAVWLAENRATLVQGERIFLGILAGVAHAHRQGLVHRNLKPGNVLMQNLDGRVLPKVTDFGLALILGDGAPPSSRSAGARAPAFTLGEVLHDVHGVGTPGYLAPEQIRDADNVDSRADIYGLGCILYELVCGTRVFTAPDVLSVIQAVATGDYAAPETIVPDLPERYRAAIRGALATRRDDRIPDCAALRVALIGSTPPSLAPWAGEGEFRQAPPDAAAADPRGGRGEGAPRPVRAELRPGPALTPSALGKASARGDTPPVENRAPRSKPRSAPEDDPFADPPRSRRSPWVIVLTLLALSGMAGVLGVGGLLFFLARPPVPAEEPEPLAETVAATPPSAVVVEPPPARRSGQPSASSARTTRAPQSGKPASPVDVPVVAPSVPAVAATESEALANVRVIGDAESVRLESGGGTFVPGEVPPGTYTVMATFGDSEISAAALTLQAGESVVLSCRSLLQVCSKQAQ